MQKLFVTCGQGLEPILEAELRELGYEAVRPGFRGVYVDVNGFDDIYKINYCSRIGGRVLLPLVQFKCRAAKSLYDGALGVDWLKMIPQGKTFAIDANVKHKELRNSLYAAQIVKDAICDQYREKTGVRPSVDTRSPDVQINLFVHQDFATISFDTSGSPLHKRGYRIEAVEAPIQESLAAALLKMANYQGNECVYDPCCGGGTFLIEAALIATHTPPGFLRQQWGFYTHPEFNQEAWEKVKAEADSKKVELPEGLIFGSDINRNAVRIARANIKTAGFYGKILVTPIDFREHEPETKPNFLITNPPHGRRLEEEEQLIPLYRALGDFMKRKLAKPARGFVFTGSLPLAKEVGLSPKKRYPIENSGVDSRFLEFDLY